MPCMNCTEDGGPLKTAAVPVPTLPMPDQEELDSKFSELVVSPLSTECLRKLYQYVDISIPYRIDLSKEG